MQTEKAWHVCPLIVVFWLVSSFPLHHHSHKASRILYSRQIKRWESIGESLSARSVVPCRTMYLNTLEKYPGKFKYALCGPLLNYVLKLSQILYHHLVKRGKSIWESLSTRSLARCRTMYLKFPGYFTIAKIIRWKSIRESLSTRCVAPFRKMYLYFPGYFTIAKQYVGKVSRKV